MSGRPLLVTAAVAIGSITLLALALTEGWLGPDVGRGANFCEAARDALVRQPANTYSNAGFVVAGLAVAWHVGRRPTNGRVMGVTMATAYASLVVLLGPGSAAMHATQSAWGGHLDMLSMYLVAGFAASYAVTSWLGRGPGTFALTFAASLVASELAGLWPHHVPVLLYGGNVAFAALLLVALVLEVSLWRRGETQCTIGFGLAAAGAMVLAFGIWVPSQHGWCNPHSLLQGHAAWHLLSAAAAYFLYQLYASERRIAA